MPMIERLREEHRRLMAEGGALRTPDGDGMLFLQRVTRFREAALAHMLAEDKRFYVPLCRLHREPFALIAETICRDAFFVEQDVEVFGDLWSLSRVRTQFDTFVRAVAILLDLLEYRVAEEEKIFALLREKGLELERIPAR